MNPASVVWHELVVMVAVLPDGERESRRAWRSAFTADLVATEVDMGDGELVYGVTHTPSGYSIAKWFQRLESAQALILQVLKLADWSEMNPDSLSRNHELAERVLNARSDIYRREAAGAFGPFNAARAESWNTMSRREQEMDATPPRLRSIA